MESYKFHLSLPSTDKKTANNKTCVLFLISSLADGATQFLTGIDQSFSSGFFSWNIFKAGDIKPKIVIYFPASRKQSRRGWTVPYRLLPPKYAKLSVVAACPTTYYETQVGSSVR